MAQNTDPCKVREEMIDTLLAFSLLSRKLAQSIAMLGSNTTTMKGDHDNVEDERTGRCAYRVVRA